MRDQDTRLSHIHVTILRFVCHTLKQPKHARTKHAQAKQKRKDRKWNLPPHLRFLPTKTNQSPTMRVSLTQHYPGLDFDNSFADSFCSEQKPEASTVHL